MGWQQDEVSYTGQTSRAALAMGVISAALAAAATIVVLQFVEQRRTCEVPAVVGRTLAEARRELVARGLTVVLGPGRADPVVEAGRVALQSPLAQARAQRGSGVVLLLSTGAPTSSQQPARRKTTAAGPKASPPADAAAAAAADAAALVRVPKVTGIKLRYARTALRRRGLKVGRIRYRTDEDHIDELVLRQKPARGSEVPPGTAVRLVVNDTNE